MLDSPHLSIQCTGQLLSYVRVRPARRGGDPRPPADLHWQHAGCHHAGPGVQAGLMKFLMFFASGACCLSCLIGEPGKLGRSLVGKSVQALATLQARPAWEVCLWSWCVSCVCLVRLGVVNDQTHQRPVGCLSQQFSVGRRQRSRYS